VLPKREAQWFHDGLDEIARVHAEQGDAQAMVVGQRRIELSSGSRSWSGGEGMAGSEPGRG